MGSQSVEYFKGKRDLSQGDPTSQFLFMIVMDYLPRGLKSMVQTKKFYFHPKCHIARIMHLMFADDLVLFTNGKESSITEIYNAVNKFLEALGLSVNKHKSQVFLGGLMTS